MTQKHGNGAVCGDTKYTLGLSKTADSNAIVGSRQKALLLARLPLGSLRVKHAC